MLIPWPRGWLARRGGSPLAPGTAACKTLPTMAEPSPGSFQTICQLVFEAAPFAILVADDGGRYLEANPMACQLFGQTREQLLGKSVYDFVDPADLDPTRDRWSHFRRDRTQSGEFPLVRPDGTRRLLRYEAVASFAPGLHVSFLEDITER